MQQLKTDTGLGLKMTCWERKLTLALLMIVLCNPGCSFLPSHLHNEANANIAVKADSEMAEYAKNAPNMYAAMLANLDKFKVEEEYLLTELAANFHTALITKLPTIKWKEFLDRIDQNQTAITDFKTQIQLETEAYLKNRGEAETNLKNAGEAVTAAKKAVQSAKEKVAAWNAYVALLQQGFGNLPDNIEDLKKDTGLKTLSKAVNEVGKEEITFRDADGNIVKSTVKAILKDRLPSITLKIEKDSERAVKLLPDAPGIALVVMNLGLGLAQLEQQRAETRLSQLNARAVLFEDALAAMNLAGTLLAEVKKEVDDYTPEQKPFNDIAFSWVTTRSPKYKGNSTAYIDLQNIISSTVLVLRKESLAESILARNQSLFKVTLARLEHQDSIVDSAIGDATWQVVIKSGLAGLVAYHQSGFTREDAANIIRIAQSIALSFIAAGTN